MKHVLVTGANGFIGRNLLVALSRTPGIETVPFDIGTPESDLNRALDICDIVIHLAGTNRPEKEEDFETGNVSSLAKVIARLSSKGNLPLIVLSSSTQAQLDNPYGRSKKRAEDMLLEHAERTRTPARIFRLPGVFGKWCRPNYNSVVATFCYNIAHGLPIQIQDGLKEIELVHVDDVVKKFVELTQEEHRGAAFADITPVFKVTLGGLAEKLEIFHKSRTNFRLIDLSDPFTRKLFGTFMSYLPPDEFAYHLEPKEDDRGILAEIAKANGHGQFFVSRTKPGITRGNHVHDTKVEKFFVLEGDALVRFRDLATNRKIDYKITGRDMRVIDIPPGWTHTITNTGTSELIVLFWASELFDAQRPDTHRSEV